MPTSGRSATRRTLLPLAAAAALAAFVAPTPATAASDDSLNCSLLAHVDSLPGSGSSCWGYVDPGTGNEYAIFGNRFGTAIYNIVDPSVPYLTGFVSGPASSWREMKTLGHYCYVGTEGGGGLQIIDLANPEAPALAATYTGNGLSTIHSVTIDSTTARLYANGANGGMRILSLANPVAPVQVGNYTATYVHDCYATNDTVYAACIGVGQVRILRTNNLPSISQIVAFSTESFSTHNAWPTEDRQYLLVTDETEGGRVTSWDISAITSPIQVDAFTDDPCGDAHNVHVRGNLAYVAHYTSGLQILDISDPTRLVRVGAYDTYPSLGLYEGAWGVFPYFPSGTIVVSDISGGMFLIDFVPNSTVEGIVTDAASSQPILAARVAAPQASPDTTDGSGGYRLFLQAGANTITAAAFGYDSSSAAVTTVADQSVTRNFALARLPGGSISGLFRTSGGSGIADAIVQLAGTPLSDTTGTTGAYSFPIVPNGSYTVVLEHWTCLPESASVSVSQSIGNSVANFTFEPVAFAYNFEDTSTAGWAVDVDGTDNATGGVWTRVNPRGESSSAAAAPLDHTPDPLKKCWITGQGVDCGPGVIHDVAGGKTTLVSPVIDLLPITDPRVEYFRWYANTEDSIPGTDAWRVQVSSDGGASWVTTDSTTASAPEWRRIRFHVADYATPSSQFRMRFIAEDAGVESVVEAGIDDVRIFGPAVVGVASIGDPSARDAAAIPAFALLPATPNPFNPRTAISFDIPARLEVRLSVYSPEGRLVGTLVSRDLPAGRHTAVWDGRDDRGRSVASGVYLMRLDAGGRRAARSIILAR
jgi:choice-of-anchor B domain-containing protein